MAMPDAITPAEQLDYLVASSGLMLWFARDWTLRHPEEPLRTVIRRRTDLYRRTDLNPGWLDHCGPVPDAWLDLLERIEAIHRETAGDADSARFEERCLALLRPHHERRVERDLADQPQATQMSGYQCGSLRHDPAPDPKRPQRIGIHMANACYPGSLFDDPLYLPACLLVLTSQCASRFGVTEIGTGSWMNSLPRWLDLFPEEWRANLGPPDEDIQWHYGFWGQFLTARRTFNHRLGEQFRRTGRIPFPMRYAWCSIAALRRHLETRLGVRDRAG